MKRGVSAVSPKRFPQPLDGIVDAVIEIDEGVGRPHSLAKFFAGYNVPWVFQQNLQDLERLFLQPDLRSVLA